MSKYKFFTFEDGEFPVGDNYAFAIENDTREFEFEKRWLTSLEETLAEHYFHNCDGWEDIWPINFCVLTEDNKEVARFKAHQALAFDIENFN